MIDESTANLDSNTGKIIIELLKKVAKDMNTTIIVATHEQGIADQTDMVFQMKDGKLMKK